MLKFNYIDHLHPKIDITSKNLKTGLVVINHMADRERDFTKNSGLNPNARKNLQL